MSEERAEAVARRLIEFLETGQAPAGLFAPDVFLDFTPPLWRIQAQGIDDVTRVRLAGHPGRGEVSAWRCDATARGFVLEFEERWVADGRPLYARELLRADLEGDRITALSVYCTGDWSAERCAQHAREVRLLRP
ncbi:MAG: hypothetical protein JNL83_25050 [Myxococcales bacterium]|nr:hypothetical protein [Myxococcales bacterium]